MLLAVEISPVSGELLARGLQEVAGGACDNVARYGTFNVDAHVAQFYSPVVLLEAELDRAGGGVDLSGAGGGVAGDEGDAVANGFVIAPQGRETVANTDGGFLHVRLQFGRRIVPHAAGLKGGKLIERGVAVEHEDVECAAGDRKGLGAFVV